MRGCKLEWSLDGSWGDFLSIWGPIWAEVGVQISPKLIQEAKNKWLQFVIDFLIDFQGFKQKPIVWSRARERMGGGQWKIYFAK